MRGKILFAALVMVASPAFAAETVSYTYDALGRLTNTVVSGGPKNGVNQTINYDAAGNRTNYTVSGNTALQSVPQPMQQPEALASAEPAKPKASRPS